MIYLFDKDERLIKIIRKPAIKTALQKYSLTKERYVSDRLTVEMKALNDDELEKVEYMAIQTMEDAHTFHYFYVAQKSSDQLTTLIGVQSGIEELRKSPVFDKRPQNALAREVINDLLSGTNWQARFVGETTPHSTNFYYVSIFDALKKVCEVWDLEMQFFVEMNGNRIGARYIDFKRKIGQAVGKRVVYGHNALQILQEVERTNIFTALVGRGKGEQVSSAEESGKQTNGFGRKITFEDVVWSTAGGKPVNKPKGQKYVELPAMTKLYGIKNADGSIRPKIGFVDFSEEENPEQLLERTYKALVNAARPQLTLKTSSVYLRGVKIGDTIRVVRHDKRLDYDTRIFDITFNRLNDQSSDIKLGDRIGESNEAKAQTIADKAIDEFVANEFSNFVQNLPDYMPTADGFNNNWYGSEDPTGKHPGKVLINDIWYKPDPEHEGHKIMLRWTGEVWEEILRTFSSEALRAKISGEIEKLDKAMKASDLALKEQTTQALRTAGANASAIEAAKSAITKLNQDLTGAKQTNQAAIDRLKSDFASAQKTASDQATLLKSDLANIRTKQSQAEAEIGKQVQALNATKTELAGVKSAQATYEQTTTRRLAELANVTDGKASKSELTQTAEELKSKIASMQASGRNLFLNSLFKQDIRKTGIWTTSTYTATIDSESKYLGHNALKIVGQDPAGKDGGNPKITYPATGQYGKVAPGSMTNQEVTISFYAKAENDGTILRSRLGNIWFKDGNVTLTTEVKRYVVKFSRAWTGLSNVTTNEWLFNLNRADTVWIWMPKFEVSGTDTPYSEAPEDTEGLISAVESTLKQKADLLEAGVSRLTEGLSTKADSSALTALSDSIKQSVKSLETNTDNKLDSKLSTAEFDVRANRISQEILNATKDKADKALVTAEAGRLREELASLSVGGRNYFLNSGVEITSGYKEIQVHPDFVKHAKGKKFVISVQVSGENVVAQNRERFGLSTSAGIVGSTNRAWSEVWETETGNISKKRIYKVFEFRDDWIDFIAGLYVQTGNGAVAGYPKLEISTVPSDWSPAPEDTEGLITEAKAVFERTVEGRFATISQQIAGKASQTDFQRVQETSKLYERLIGSTEKEVADKVSRMALTNELFQVEVSKNLGLRTVQYQIANAWAVQNLNSNGDIISQINATGPNVRIQGESIHLDGKTLIDNGVIKNAMIESMLADKIIAGTLNAANVNIINLNANKLVGLDADFIKSKIELAFIEWMRGKTISAQNDAMQINLNDGHVLFYNDDASIKRVLAGYPTQFIRYENKVENGQNHGRTIIGSNRNGTNAWKSASFAGIVIDNNSNNSIDKIYQFGDYNHLRHAQGDEGWDFSVVTQTMTPGTWNKNSEIWARHFVVPRNTKGDTDKPTQFIRLEESVAAIWDILNHAASGQITMTQAMKNLINSRKATWDIVRNAG